MKEEIKLKLYIYLCVQFIIMTIINFKKHTRNKKLNKKSNSRQRITFIKIVKNRNTFAITIQFF